MEQSLKDERIELELLEGSPIWEFRILYNRIAYRLFAFWDTESGKMIVATHGIVKKTQKTPVKDIAKAEALRKAYFKSKADEQDENAPLREGSR